DGTDLVALADEDLDLLLGFLERLLAGAGQLDTPLEGLEGFFQREVALFHAADQLLELLQCVFEVEGFAFSGHGSALLGGGAETITYGSDSGQFAEARRTSKQENRR